MALAELSTTTTEARWAAAYEVFAPKVRTWARNSSYLFPGCAMEDVEQELFEVLHLAVLSYDPFKGATFNSYAQECFKRRISDLKRKAEAIKRRTERGWVDLDDDAVRYAVNERFQEMSAEELSFVYADLRTMAVYEDRRTQGRKPRRSKSTSVSRQAG
jgi:DNA-directed RNA polymerase specialized sigma subunit